VFVWDREQFVVTNVCMGHYCYTNCQGVGIYGKRENVSYLAGLKEGVGVVF
jgi:hypothetical protein